jgi:threo-3-hydroxy-L-aspartate ammonia-lyase
MPNLSKYTTYKTIEDAYNYLQQEKIVITSPVVEISKLLAQAIPEMAKAKGIFIKLEYLQPSKSFKIRGIANTLSKFSCKELANGVITYSSGSAAIALSYVGKILKIPTTVIVPDDVPKSKLAQMQVYGAEIIHYNRFTDDRETLTYELSEKYKMVLVPPYDHFDVIAGNGTVALEFLQQVSCLDVLVCPIGGGSLIAGCGVYAKKINPKLKLIGVEPINGDDTAQSLRTGQRVTIIPPETMMSALRTITPGKLTFPIIQEYVDDITLITDAEALEATSFLYSMNQIVESSGAAALAAVMAGKVEIAGKHIGIVLTGGNV